MSAYCASKFAVIGFTQSLANEVAPHNITANAVCPGILGTTMWLDVMLAERGVQGVEDREAAFREFAKSYMPLGRHRRGRGVPGAGGQRDGHRAQRGGRFRHALIRAAPP